MSLWKRARDSQETLHARTPFLLTFSRSTFSTHAHLSAPRLDWMARVQRPAIQANIGAETVRLNEPLRGVVAALAQALERTEPEFVDVAVMRPGVIAFLP